MHCIKEFKSQILQMLWEENKIFKPSARTKLCQYFES